LRAVASYKPALHVHWGNALLDHRTADPAQRLANLQKARVQFERSLRRDRTVTLAHSGLGNVFGEMERLGMGRGYMIAAACIYRDGGNERRFDPQLRHYLANLLQRYGELIERTERAEGRPWDAAARWKEVAFEPAVVQYCRRRDPMNSHKKDKAVTSRLRTLELAVAKHRKAAELEPTSERYHVAWAQAEMKLAQEIVLVDSSRQGEVARRLALADRSFRRSLDLGRGESFEAWQGRARLRLLEGEPAAGFAIWWEAAANFARGAQARPDDPWLRYHQGRAYAELGERERAFATLASVLERHGSFAPAHLQLARILAAEKRELEAWRHYSRVLLLDAQSLEPQDEPVVEELRSRLGIVR
jgi:tetratricopeptide (TPR) repeat protein